jgi:hypothetical protein
VAGVSSPDKTLHLDPSASHELLMGSRRMATADAMLAWMRERAVEAPAEAPAEAAAAAADASVPPGAAPGCGGDAPVAAAEGGPEVEGHVVDA